MDTNKILVVVGPTASGKSELAVRLAKKFNGEIISADSRQVYRGMDIGTGKVEGNWHAVPCSCHPALDAGSYRKPKKIPAYAGMTQQLYLYKSIPHYAIDIASPRTQYSVAQFQKYAKKIIADIHTRGKLPIICGGTGHWVDAVVYDQIIPAVKPDPALRRKLEKKSVDQLFAKLKKLDPVRAQTIDPKNPRRLIRALEIILTTNQPIPLLSARSSPYSPLFLGIIIDQDQLYKKIDVRLKQRLEAGMLHEAKTLHTQGISWHRLESFGLEYKYCALHLQNKLSYDDMVSQLSAAIKHYAKRQLTWFKRNKSIHWLTTYQQAASLTKTFLSS